MSAHEKTKILITELKKLVLLSQHKLHMKLTTSLYSVIQQAIPCSVTSFNKSFLTSAGALNFYEW